MVGGALPYCTEAVADARMTGTSGAAEPFVPHAAGRGWSTPEAGPVRASTKTCEGETEPEAPGPEMTGGPKVA